MYTCILVGNSSNILNKNLGSYIDGFDNVVRFDRFKIKGYETDLGRKCTYWVLNYKLTTDNRNYIVKNLDKVRKDTYGLKQALILTTQEDKKNIIEKIKKKVDVDIVYQQLKKKFKHKPTTGYLTINYLLQFFPQLVLIGFDFGKSNHYWGNHGISDVPGKHEWGKEKKYIDSLVRQNKIKIIQNEQS